MANNMIDVLNGILASSSADYQNYVPLATRDNLDAVANPILTYSIVKNEFVTALMNKVVLSVVHKKLLTNPLAPLKRGNLPLGQDVEEIHVNRATGDKYDPTGADLLTRKKPTALVSYHRLNRQDTYQVSVSDDQLRQAFTSYEALQNFVDAIIQSLYSADSDDEFILMKQLVSEAVANEHVVTVEVPRFADADTGALDSAVLKGIVAAFKNTSSYMSFAGDSFNKYATINEGAEPIRTKTDIGDQVLVIRADINNATDVEVLASAFNLDKMSFLANRVLVDNFGEDDDIVAMLCDKSFFQVYDQMRKTTEFYNPKGLYTNFYHHVWQTMSYSTMVNCAVFKQVALIP